MQKIEMTLAPSINTILTSAHSFAARTRDFILFTMAGESELSIEETNKLRLSLGLKPLRVDSEPAAPIANGEPVYEDTVEGHERRAVDNWKAHTAGLEKEAARKRRLDDIKKAREAAQRFRKLEGTGLADEEEEEDTASWVRKMKKRQKKKADEIAREMEEELERAAAERRDYTAAELKGLKVSHDLARLGEMGGETILTLKDSTIDENEGVLLPFMLGMGLTLR